MRRASAVALLFVILTCAAAAEAPPNVHEIPGAGISLTAPAGWTFEVGAPDLATVQDTGGTGAVFVIAIQATPVPPPPNAAPGLLAHTVASLEQKYPDFTIEEPIRATTVARRHAAELTATYTHTQHGVSVLLRSRIVLIPRKRGVIVVNLTTETDAGEAARKQLAGILESLQIAD